MLSGSGTATILVVESPGIKELIRLLLERHGYALIEADVEAGLRLLETPHTRIDLLITNRPAPFLHCRQTLPILYVSGSPDRELMRQAGKRIFRVLQKPFTHRTLVAAVREILQH